LSFTEIHFHLLPGVDDGPRSVDESLELAAAAVADGTRTVIVTPHVHPAHITDPGEIPERMTALADRLRRKRIGLSLVPGGELEYTMVERLLQAELEQIAHGPRGRRWLLFEAPFDGLGEPFTAAADELRHRGFGIVLAHPERTEVTPETNAALEHELARGTVLQLTASAFTGAHSRPVRDAALRLLRTAPRAVIASDAHGCARPPALRDAVAALSTAGEPDPRRYAASVPQALLTHGLAAGPAMLAA
jgi:protein-tyrosine phosphatase